MARGVAVPSLAALTSMQPDKLGRYRILGILGRGGMGVVYEGLDPQIDRPVAIKTIALDALDEREKSMFEVRFAAEMRSSGRLQHHNIAALYDTGRDGGTAYIVMERVSGHDLKWHLAAGERFSTQQAVAITQQLLAALNYAHGRQVIHRDVKPANVILQSDGVIKLCDFGVARLADADATRTQGMVVGSLRYASPEQVLGQTIDARTDLFSAGVLLFELLTGAQPFKGQSDVEILHRIATEPAPSPRALDPTIPIEIDAAVRRAMAKHPDERFGSAAEFSKALGDSALTLPGNLLPARALAGPTPPHDATASVRGNRPSWWAAGGAVLLLAVGAWALMRPTPETLATIQSQAAVPALTAASRPQAPLLVAPPAAPTSELPARLPVPAPAVATSGSPLPVPVPVPVPPPSLSTSAASTPAPARTEASASASKQLLRMAPPPSKVSLLPTEGVWRGQLACGPVLSRPDGPGNAAFTADLDIHVEGQRIRWTRQTARVSETVEGRFDEQGRFSAEGQGARKDRAETWLERASGLFVPATRRIEGQLQILRSKDKSVARDCTIVARRDEAPGDRGLNASPSTSSVNRPQNLAAVQGAWRGRLACGASLSVNVPQATVMAYTVDLEIDIAGSRITLLRENSRLQEKAAGDVDVQGRFTAEGLGAFKDSSGNWLLQASGGYLPKTGRIEGRMQLLRGSDRGLARECSFRAERR